MAQEQQEEELEVLRSIYEGDERFKEVNATTYQYKVGEDAHYKSFLLEIVWTDSYPDEMPNINLNAFYNKHILPEVKDSVIEKLVVEGEMLIGCAMTYTLFEFAKENAVDLMADQVEVVFQSQEMKNKSTENEGPTQKKERKEQLTKAQKRKIVNRTDNTGELPRGWNWVDVIKHISQTGRSSKTEAAETNPDLKS